MQLSNINYWQDVYSQDSVPAYPSQFAAFVQSCLAHSGQTIVELGCGNGRDSLFFNSVGHRMIVTDQVISDELLSVEKNIDRFNCIEGDIAESLVNLNDHVAETDRVVIYSRFFQHAINEKKQKEMLDILRSNLDQDAVLYFEFRLDKDKDREKAFGTSHYRRFQSSEEFIKTVKSCGFDCDYHCEGFGYARYKNEDPYVGRFIVSPKQQPKLRSVS